MCLKAFKFYLLILINMSFFKAEFNKSYEILVLYEDKYDINWFYYHKDGWKKVKCWCHIHTDCHLCNKSKAQFLSIAPIYIRENQESQMLFLNKKELDSLVNLIQDLVSKWIINKDLTDIKNHFFSLRKTYDWFKFEYLRKHNYKKLNLNLDFNVKEYIKRNYLSYDAYWFIERDYILKKLQLNYQF